MGLKFWQTPSFKALQKQWECKLKESGFEDAEKTIKEERRLKQRASNSYRGACLLIREAKRRYFELLGVWYHKEKWSDSVEAFVLERRSQGTRIKQISEELRAKGERCHRETIRGIIRKYEIKWGIKRN